jgi:OOP family OmpA-OmpF porin
MKALPLILLLAGALLMTAAIPVSANNWSANIAKQQALNREKPDSRALCYILWWPVWGKCKCETTYSEADSDMDGVPDSRDKCPNTPRGCIVDKNGCPTDSDHDGVCDGADKCPDTPAGTKVDATGCPATVDSDGDGVPDDLDQCPNTPRGARVDSRGCPIDSDGDGVPDGIDRCPDTPRGCGVDRDGCPLDSDHDGVCDGLDRCPNTPAGAQVDENGCTIEAKKFIDTGLISTTKILFDTGKSTLKPESKSELDKIGGILAEVPDTRVEIGGHTDNVGSEQLNMKLSEERALAVKEYLLKNFPQLKAENLSAKGYGESKPVASNNTKEGRAQNRRVEFAIIK